MRHGPHMPPTQRLPEPKWRIVLDASFSNSTRIRKFFWAAEAGFSRLERIISVEA